MTIGRRVSKAKCQRIVSKEARKHYKKGKPAKQHVAIGYSKARKAGCKFVKYNRGRKR